MPQIQLQLLRISLSLHRGLRLALVLTITPRGLERRQCPVLGLASAGEGCSNTQVGRFSVSSSITTLHWALYMRQRTVEATYGCTPEHLLDVPLSGVSVILQPVHC